MIEKNVFLKKLEIWKKYFYKCIYFVELKM